MLSLGNDPQGQSPPQPPRSPPTGARPRFRKHRSERSVTLPQTTTIVPAPQQVRLPPFLGRTPGPRRAAQGRRGPEPRPPGPRAPGPPPPAPGRAARGRRASPRGEGRPALNLSRRRRMGEAPFFPPEFSSRPRYQQIRAIRTFLIFALLPRLATPKFPNPLKQSAAGHMLSPVTKVRAAHGQGAASPGPRARREGPQ